MKPELREQLGQRVFQVYYERIVNTIAPETKDVTWEQQWEQTEDKVKELYRLEGEAAVSSFVTMLMPGVQSVIAAIVPVLNDEQRANLVAAVASITAMVEE